MKLEGWLRTTLARGALLVCFVALAATSDLPDWSVEDRAYETLEFAPSTPSRRKTEALVIYRTPRGTWPLHLGASVVGDWEDARIAMSALMQDERVRLVSAPSTVGYRSMQYEIVCKEKLCEGSLMVSIEAEQPGPATPPIDGGRLSGWDGGTIAPGTVDIQLRASFDGGLESEPIWSCHRKDSSTDTEDAPKELGLELTLHPFQDDPSAPLVPVARPDASLPRALDPVGLDAGLGG